MIPLESDRICWNSGIPVNSCGFRWNFRIPADSSRICGGIKSIVSSSCLPCPHPCPPCPPPHLAYPPPLFLVFISFPLFVVSLPPPFVSSTSFPHPFCPPHPPRLLSSSLSCPPSSLLCYRGWSVVHRLHRARQFSLLVVIVRPRHPCHPPGYRNSSIEQQVPPTSLWRGEGWDTYCICWGIGG